MWWHEDVGMYFSFADMRSRWDLLPHGDTLRDIPYLVKDFARKVLHTVNGGGRRAGYSAV